MVRKIAQALGAKVTALGLKRLRAKEPSEAAVRAVLEREHKHVASHETHRFTYGELLVQEPDPQRKLSLFLQALTRNTTTHQVPWRSSGVFHFDKKDWRRNKRRLPLHGLGVTSIAPSKEYRDGVAVGIAPHPKLVELLGKYNLSREIQLRNLTRGKSWRYGEDGRLEILD